MVFRTHRTNQDLSRCLQLTVTGSGTATPPASALAAIPGVYKMSDPSIDIDVYSQPGVTVSHFDFRKVSRLRSDCLQLKQTYTIPGPAPWTG